MLLNILPHFLLQFFFSYFPPLKPRCVLWSKNTVKCIVNLTYLCIIYYFFKSSPEDIFSLLLERKERGKEREREREREWERERDSDVRYNHQPKYVSWPGIDPATFWLQDGAPNKQHQLGHFFLLLNCYF